MSIGLSPELIRDVRKAGAGCLQVIEYGLYVKRGRPCLAVYVGIFVNPGL